MYIYIYIYIIYTSHIYIHIIYMMQPPRSPPQRVWVYRFRTMGIPELCSPPPPVGGWGGVVVVSCSE